MRLIILGPPGSGKGTQAKMLCQCLGATHLATGDVLREAVRHGTPIGRQAKAFMEQGKYVPDELVNEIVAEKLSQPDRLDKFILDGYPRTEAQARALDVVLVANDLRLNAAVYLRVPDGEIVRRVSGRRTCPNCGALYHVINKPPKAAEVCDGCGTRLEHRDDDQEGTIRNRLVVFHQTMPQVIGYYRQQKLLHEVDGHGNITDVNAAILTGLGVERKAC
jgi:adenylate kinase